MRKPVRNLWVGAGVAVAIGAACLAMLFTRGTGASPEDVLQALAHAAQVSQVIVEYPLDGTLFPPELPAPNFRWKEKDARADLWLVSLEFSDGAERLHQWVPQHEWRPETTVWADIKNRSLAKPATVTIIGVNHKRPAQVLSAGRITIRTSSDSVGAPLFYREVNLPFVEAVKDPSTIRWRFGAVSSAEPPPIVLEKLPVCGNCHSFSANAGILGMDIDYANDKGSYAITGVQEEMTLDKSAIITWSDYRRGDGELTFGLLSQVSPDGRYVVSTVKDESVFVPKAGLEFSQLFFPVKGILCIYDRQTGTFQSLPGADDPKLVQSNPTWSPEGKYLVFAATEAHQLRRSGGPRTVLLNPADCREFLEEGKPFKFNLYRIPFNEGRGGKAEPIAGASFNGKSNFFPKYSPDGKWIVFCQAQNYMLLQPDSELYIIPAEGGEARRLRANTKRMNSWHSLSPNGKWLVFSGKPDSAYTRLYLTHIDEQGESTPPVVLDRLTASDRAANIPEFVNASPTAMRHIREQFIDDVSYIRAAWEYLKSNDYTGAERQARKALELNPRNAEALHYLGLALFGGKQHDEAIRYLSQAAQAKPEAGDVQAELGVVLLVTNRLNEAVDHLRKSLEISPNNAEAYFNLGVAMYRRGDKQEAIKCWARAVEIKPDDHEAHYNLADVLEEQKDLDGAIEHYRRTVQVKPDHLLAQGRLGVALCRKGLLREAVPHLSKAVELDPANTALRYNLAITLAQLKQHDQAIVHLLQIMRLDPRNTEALMCVAMCYAETGQIGKALSSLEEARKIAESAGDKNLLGQIGRRVELYQQRKPPDRSSSP